MGYLKNRTMHELRRVRATYRYRHEHEFTPNMSTRQVKKILARHDLGFDKDGLATWWYSSLDLKRNEEDDLTKAALRYASTTIDHDGRILVTGCGTGWMLIWLAQQGFQNLEGFDYLDNVVKAAEEIAALGRMNAKLWKDDGFDPTLDGQYDLIMVLHWLYSAWMGNYGNQPRGHDDREALLRSFLAHYSEHVKPNGLVMVELIDSVSDYLEPPTDVYPIRHSFEQVERCATALGFIVEKRMFNFRYGRLPRMLYFLRRS